MNNKYDVAIIGMGPGGIFAAYELIKRNPQLKIVMIEQGNDIYTRNCPIGKGKITKCINCNPCSIMRGFGGAGAFSDGKYNFTTEYGGILNEYLSDKEVMNLIEYVDEINLNMLSICDDSNRIPSKYTSNDSKWKKIALENDMHLLTGSVRHLGTEKNYKILSQLYLELKDKVTMLFNTPVFKFYKSNRNDLFVLEIRDKYKKVIDITSDYLIAAPGRAGAEWFAEQCKLLDLKLINNQVDIGVRVELPAEVFKHITDDLYELKVKYRSSGYEDIIRTFCMNPNGYVVSENTDGIITVNGHSYDDPKYHSNNTNFALLVSNTFTEPFNEPHKYGKSIASFSNMLGGGIIVQRFGDLIKNRRTNAHRLEKSFTKPTLNATPGDLSLVLPKRHLDNIIEMIYKLDKIAPGTANDDTLLYGVEVKFYSSRLELSNELETKIINMFGIGDGAGVTRGLSQAAASGIHVAKIIDNRIKGDIK